MPDSPFKMTVDLNVLDHLAEGLYSSVAAALTEAVANAWDADAVRVGVDLDFNHDSIAVVDDGIGMDVAAVNERYLRVGFRRREESDTSAGGRAVMGRKGIGKLSLFSIADVVQVETKAAGRGAIGLRIAATELRQAMAERRPEYQPDPVEVRDESFPSGHGTRITVSALKRQRLREIEPTSLKRRLARRFSIIGSAGFQVAVNGAPVSAADREDLRFVEYLWVFSGTSIETAHCAGLRQTLTLPSAPSGWDSSWQLGGWLGTVDKPKRLATGEGNLNSIVVMARGRLVDEDVLPRVTNAEFYSKYLTGQIEADFLDATTNNDIVTSNRQRLMEDDARLQAVLAYLDELIRGIAEQWSDLRTGQRTEELRDRFPAIGRWLDGLQSGLRPKAEQLLKRIATIEVGGDDQDHEENQRTLLRHAIYGFERLRLRGDAEELEVSMAGGVDSLLRVLADRDSLEAASYADIVRNRLAVITKLGNLTEANARERVLQEYLFDHLWLLDPAWERATDSQAMERRLRLRPEFRDDGATKELYGRIDIRYRTVAAKHVIVELKRYSARPTVADLLEQGASYVDGLKDSLPLESRESASIEVVFVLGARPPDPPARIAHVMSGVAPGSRIVTYDLLVDSARAAYDEFLRRAESVDRLSRMFEPSQEGSDPGAAPE